MSSINPLPLLSHLWQCSWSNELVFLSPDRFLALGMKIEFPVEYRVVITWWQRASEKRTDWKMSGALCWEIRCRQHSLEVMWSLRGNTLAAFYPNHRGVFGNRANPGGIFTMLCSEWMYHFKVQYRACPCHDLFQVTCLDLGLPQLGSPLYTDTLALQNT